MPIKLNRRAGTAKRLIVGALSRITVACRHKKADPTHFCIGPALMSLRQRDYRAVRDPSRRVQVDQRDARAVVPLRPLVRTL